jgi:hypothetical protein
MGVGWGGASLDPCFDFLSIGSCTFLTAPPPSPWLHVYTQPLLGSGDAAYLLCMLCCIYLLLMMACVR